MLSDERNYERWTKEVDLVLDCEYNLCLEDFDPDQVERCWSQGCSPRVAADRLATGEQ